MGDRLRCDNRKEIMFKKISFKRVALVAVAAMGFGLLSAVSSNAVPTISNTTMYDTVHGYQIAGGQATVSLTVDTSTTTNIVVSGVGSVLSATAGAGSPVVSGTPTTGTFIVTGAGATGTAAIVLTSSALGTQTITATPLDNNGTPGTAVTHTITWISTSTTAVNASTSTVVMAIGTGTPAVAAVDDVIVAPKTPGTQVANILVSPKDSNSTALAGQTLSATITGPGMMAWSNTSAVAVGNARATSITLTTETAAWLGINSDGTAGTTVVTITDGSTVLATKTLTFTGSASNYVVASSFSNLQVGANGANNSSASNAIAVKVTDVNGNPVVNGTTVYATSANTSVATVATSLNTVAGYVYFAVQGVSSGTTSILFTDQPTGTTPTVSATATSVKVTSVVASAVTLTLDKASYAPGEKMVLTLSAKDSAGNGIADTGVYTNFLATGGITTNVALQGDPITGVSPTFANGVVKYTLYAPATAGTVNIFATTGTSANLAVAAQKVSLTATASVVADTSNIDALKAQIQVLQDAAAKAATDAATNAALVATANAATQAALTVQLKALQASNASALALIKSLTKTINALNLKLNSKTIVCTKYHAVNKTVKGLKPVCPTGYKLKK